MKRLVSFGCSYTYGGFLKDPLVESWPHHLAQHFGVNFKNMAKPGSSNLEILWDIMNYRFQPDDWVFVMWTHFPRTIIFNATGRHERIGPWRQEQALYENWLSYNNDTSINIKNWITIDHATLHLEREGIDYRMIIGGNPDERNSFPLCIKPRNFLDLEFVNYDFASDLSHPGPESHKILAEKIYRLVKTDLD